MGDRAGRYRIQVVAELTGIPAPTLRAWERRHGIPSPARTASAYRLYSDEDVDMVRRLRELCATGMAIAEAARVVRASHGEVTTDPGLDPYATAVTRIVDAVTLFDPEGTAREVSRAVYLGPAITVYQRSLAPALHRIGELWQEGALTIGQEHLASNIIGDAARALARIVQPPDAERRFLLACFDGELHDIGLHGVAIRLASWGIRSVTLGARTPAEALGFAVQRLQPDAVGLSVIVAPSAERVVSLVGDYALACGKIPWFVGGAAADSVSEAVTAAGGVIIPGDFAAARPLVERVLSTMARGTHGTRGGPGTVGSER